jgi:ATP-dependent exoDNAse (exonuclease V) alpha subunit
LAIANNKSQITIRKQFPIQLACARTIHRTQGLTLDGLAFDPTGVTQDGLVYTALSRIKNISSIYLIQKLTPKKFHVNTKVSNEMTRLETIVPWKLEFAKKTTTIQTYYQLKH